MEKAWDYGTLWPRIRWIKHELMRPSYPSSSTDFGYDGVDSAHAASKTEPMIEVASTNVPQFHERQNGKKRSFYLVMHLNETFRRDPLICCELTKRIMRPMEVLDAQTQFARSQKAR